MPISLPDLPFDKGALEPHVSARTFEFHHDKHHKAYVRGADDSDHWLLREYFPKTR